MEDDRSNHDADVEVTDSTIPTSRWSRRSFIGGSVGAAAVGLVACDSGSDGEVSSSVPTTDPTTTDPTPPTTAPSGGNGNGNGNGDETPVPTTGIDPATVGETWNDPWIWRPTGDPADVLSLYVVENFASIAIQGGNLDGSIEPGTPLLFSWNGVSPGPTIRMKGTDTLNLKLYNQLGRDNGQSTYGPNPDIAAGPYPGQEGPWLTADNGVGNVYQPGALAPCKIPTELYDDWCLGEHVNGIHSVHVTNIHTHGLHVKPGRTKISNPDGTSSFLYSDDIYARIIPRADAARGIEEFGSLEAYKSACFPTDQVEVGEANYQFDLGNTELVPVHPPGTHWYHPHVHGATHQQVASGMAGFLIVEGDVDEAVNVALAGVADPDPELATGDWEYRERTVMIQRIANNRAVDSDAPGSATPKVLQGTSFPVVNGTFNPGTIVVSPGAIERWRILNGSVDGGGYFRVALLKGEFTIDSTNLLRATDGRQVVTADYWPVVLAEHAANPTQAELDSENLKTRLWHLAHDGVTLVDEAGNYYVKNLDGTDINLGAEATLASCYTADNLPSSYDRPNELRLTTGTRADVFFQAPALADPADPEQQNPGTPEIYTLVGLPTSLHGNTTKPIIAAYVIVRGPEVPNAEFDYDFQADIQMPEVPAYLSPIASTDERMRDPDGNFRTRTVRYAGWGAADFPQMIVPPGFAADHPDLSKLTYYEAPSTLDCGPDPTAKKDTTPTIRTQTNPTRVGAGAESDSALPIVVVPPNTRSMSIDGAKFDPGATDTPRMELDTVEEWAVFNQSIDCFGAPPSADDPEQIWFTFDEAAKFPPPKGAPTDPANPDWRQYYPGHAVAHPLRLADVPETWRTVKPNQDARQWPIASRVAKGVDHPFHIHQNPFWLLRIDVPDDRGNLVNILPEPRWGDVQWVPRNGGRLVFRSRFDDFVGELVNHCHILKHEDNGMMQRIQVVPNPNDDGPQDPNYVPASAVLDPNDDDVADQLYPPPDVGASYVQSAMFVDPNPITGQIMDQTTGEMTPFPGFAVSAPSKPTGG